MTIVKQKHDHIRKLKRQYKNRSQQLKGILKDDSPLIKTLYKDMPMTTVTLLLSQIRCAKRAPRGRRWTEDEKVIALSLYKRGPKCYSLLRRFIALPSVRTLQTLLSNFTFKPGINGNIF